MAARAKEAPRATISDGAPKKPLIFASNPFEDERLDDLEFADAKFDASYIPGYGERRNENQHRARDGKPLLEIPRFQWVRISKKGGAAVTESDEGMLEWLKLGYRACGVEDLENLGFGFPPTAHVGPDGLIRRGDLALFFASAKRAERNRLRQKEVNKAYAARGIMTGETDSVYEVEKDRVKTQGTLKELSNTELPSLE